MKAQVKTRVSDLVSRNKSRSIIIAALLADDLAKDQKEAESYCDELGVVKGNRTTADLYAVIESGVSDRQLADFILQNGTRNQGRWFGQWAKINETVNRVRDSFDAGITREAATAEQLDQLKKMK